MIRRLAAVALAFHGVIHVIGFVSPWRLAAIEGFAYRTTIFDGAMDVGDSAARLIGLVWLALAFGFMTAGFAVWRRRRWAAPLTAALALISLLVCVAGLPDTAAGVAIGVLVVAAVGWAVRPGGALRPETL